jgi:serum/glucocorticoid-regulated kinase 2
MEELNSPYLAKLFYSFESKYYLVFVMEYCAGGELFYHLRKLRRLNE